MTDPRELIRADETLDDLLLNNLQIIQPVRGYRFSLDAVLLAHFPELEKASRVFDLGTGSGIIPLLLTTRNPQLQITGIEIQSAMADRARRSVTINGLEDKIEIIEADVSQLPKNQPGGSADLVLSNPPFWKMGEGYVSSNQEEAIARHEMNLKMDQLLKAGEYLLVPGGALAVVQPARRLEEMLESFQRHHLYPHKLRLVHSFIDRNASLVLLEGRKNRRGSLEIMPPLVIYERPNQYSAEIKKLYEER